LNIVYSQDEQNKFFQKQFEFHWPLRDNLVPKYEYLESQLATHFESILSTKKITLARYFPDRGQWLLLDPSVTTNKKTKNTNQNLKLEPFKLTDLAVIGVLPGEHLTVDDFDSEYDRMKRQELELEKEQKRNNRERNRADNDRNQQNGGSGRRKSPQNTMRITVDDFDT